VNTIPLWKRTNSLECHKNMPNSMPLQGFGKKLSLGGKICFLDAHGGICHQINTYGRLYGSLESWWMYVRYVGCKRTLGDVCRAFAGSCSHLESLGYSAMLRMRGESFCFQKRPSIWMSLPIIATPYQKRKPERGKAWAGYAWRELQGRTLEGRERKTQGIHCF